MALVTLAQARTHIKADWIGTTSGPQDTELQSKVDQASDIILGYLKKASTYWDENTAPDRVQAMTLLLVAHLYEHRGDDMVTVDEAVWQAIQRLGVRDQTSALA